MPILEQPRVLAGRAFAKHGKLMRTHVGGFEIHGPAKFNAIDEFMLLQQFAGHPVESRFSQIRCRHEKGHETVDLVVCGSNPSEYSVFPGQ